MAKQTVAARCPDCGDQIELWPLLQVGEELLCPHCDADLMVVSVDPLRLDWADIPSAEEDEDWDDWDEDDEDDEDQ